MLHLFHACTGQACSCPWRSDATWQFLKIKRCSDVQFVAQWRGIVAASASDAKVPTKSAKNACVWNDPLLVMASLSEAMISAAGACPFCLIPTAKIQTKPRILSRPTAAKHPSLSITRCPTFRAFCKRWLLNLTLSSKTSNLAALRNKVSTMRRFRLHACKDSAKPARPLQSAGDVATKKSPQPSQAPAVDRPA